MYLDHSPEAAEQLAELRRYGKLSEEARRKANLTDDGDEGDGVDERGDARDAGGDVRGEKVKMGANVNIKETKERRVHQMCRITRYSYCFNLL